LFILVGIYVFAPYDDVDLPTPSGEKRPPFPPRTSYESSAKRTKPDVPDKQFISVDNQMNKKLHICLNAASGDPKEMSELLSTILSALTKVLSTTDAKATALSESPRSEADNLVQNGNPQERTEWEVGLRRVWKNVIGVT
jgi:hypothetical protein